MHLVFVNIEKFGGQTLSKGVATMMWYFFIKPEALDI
jgi:hypothetical protein